MFNTLYGRLVTVLVGFALIMAAIFLAVTHSSFTARTQEINQRLYRSYPNALLGKRLLSEDDRIDPATVKDAFDRLRIANPRIDFYLLDRQGRIIASSGRNVVLRATVGLTPVRLFLDGGAALSILGDDPSEASLQRAFSVAPVSLKDGTGGYLYFVLRGTSGETLAQEIRTSYALRETLWSMAGGLLLALLVSALIVRFMTHRLQRLTSVMDRFRQSGFAAPPDPSASRPVAHADEVAHLTETFNEMAERMLAQMNELQRTDNNRRELFANISHDLRTPLASLQGHLETLQLKGDRLPVDEKNHYLEIALRQSEHLNRLVAKLFELAKLDSEETGILPEPFVLEDLVQDVAQEFQLAASHQQVSLAADQPAEPSLVMGDIGLIERVLRNLIENSLRHTPAGGDIRVRIVPDRRHVTVQVSDTGSGIRAEDLPRIFERSFRGEKSRSDSSGAGLGLAIARRILELHASQVTVASEPGATTISFTLSRADAPSAAIEGKSYSDPVPVVA